MHTSAAVAGRMGLVAAAVVLGVPLLVPSARAGPNEESWVIVTDKGSGEIVAVDETTGKTLPAPPSPAADASGSLRPASSACDAMSYHGTLGGNVDPDPSGCGWGKAVPRLQVSKVVDDLALAISYETGVVKAASGKPPSFSKDRQEHANDALKEARDHDIKAAGITGGAADAIREGIVNAIKADIRASLKTIKVDPATADPAVFDEYRRGIEVAVTFKREALAEVPEEKLLANPATVTLPAWAAGAGTVSTTGGAQTQVSFSFRSKTKVARYAVVVYGGATIASATVDGKSAIGTAEEHSALAVVPPTPVAAGGLVTGEIVLDKPLPAGAVITVSTAETETPTSYENFTLTGPLALPASASSEKNSPAPAGGKGGASAGGKKGKKGGKTGSATGTSHGASPNPSTPAGVTCGGTFTGSPRTIPPVVNGRGTYLFWPTRAIPRCAWQSSAQPYYQLRIYDGSHKLLAIYGAGYGQAEAKGASTVTNFVVGTVHVNYGYSWTKPVQPATQPDGTATCTASGICALGYAPSGSPSITLQPVLTWGTRVR